MLKKGNVVVNIHTNKVVKMIGQAESNTRFLNMALYQGAPRKKHLDLNMAAADNPAFKDMDVLDPTLFCTAYKKDRFYLLTNRNPLAEDKSTENARSRDVFNEKPSREEQTLAAVQSQKALASTAIMYTTAGDIHLKLFPSQAPKTCENFITHAKNGYYNGIKFHRVIKNFMLQTGDPKGGSCLSCQLLRRETK